MAQPLTSDLSNGILRLSFNRPQAYNAFTRELALALQEQLDRAHTDSSIKVVVLTGEGKAFCAGQDLQELLGDDAPPMGKILKEHFNPVVSKIRACSKPIIAEVNGVAAGAGANIAIACDMAVASQQASFIQAFSKIGLIPDSGGTWTLPRLIGWQKATALMMTGEKVSAQDAEAMGMIYKSVPHEELRSTVDRLATTLAQMPSKAFELTKKALNASSTNSFEEQLAVEDELQFTAIQTWDYQEGVQAFVEKRKPQFRGE